jgi:putative hydrolase of the HAD superfamily
MTIKPNKTCLVMDLDDTLYKEYDYQTSGLKYVERAVSDLYGIDLINYLIDLREKGVSDVFLEMINSLGLSKETKESLIYLYRNHMPNINLSQETQSFMDSVLSDFKQVVILTDGRSISQRMKLKALGLIDIPVYISEEWNSLKPDQKRFSAIMNKYHNSSLFCYIGDNPAIDFIAPKRLDWATFCLKGDMHNVHSQSLRGVRKESLPDHYLNNLNEFLSFVEY